MLESTFLNKFRSVWKKQFPDDYVLKLSERYVSGVPDLMMIHDGYAIMVEMKVRGNKPTPLQNATLGKIRDAGGVGAVLTYMTDGDYALMIGDETKRLGTMEEVVWELISCLVQF